MPDYNPDREGHRKHKWIVHKAINNSGFKNVVAADKVMPFNHEGRFFVKDASVAAEIRQKYPRSVTVSRVTASDATDRDHKNFFSCPAMPWHNKEKDDADQDRK